jgi:hypothetical protein
MSDLPGVVRFIYAEGDGRAVSRVEGRRQCGHCDRWHPYQVGLLGANDEVLGDILVDSREEAEAQVSEWLAQGLRFLGHRETEVESDATEQLFTSRTAAIDWLLEGTRQ